MRDSLFSIIKKRKEKTVSKTPLIDVIVNNIVNSFTDEMCSSYYRQTITKDTNFDITAHHTNGSPEEVTREVVSQYVYTQIWTILHRQIGDDDKVEKIFLT